MATNLELLAWQRADAGVLAPEPAGVSLVEVSAVDVDGARRGVDLDRRDAAPTLQRPLAQLDRLVLGVRHDARGALDPAGDL